MNCKNCIYGKDRDVKFEVVRCSNELSVACGDYVGYEFNCEHWDGKRADYSFRGKVNRRGLTRAIDEIMEG